MPSSTPPPHRYHHECDSLNSTHDLQTLHSPATPTTKETNISNSDPVGRLEHLTVRLLQERDKIAGRLEECRQTSTTPSLASITNTEESFQYRGQPIPNSSYRPQHHPDRTQNRTVSTTGQVGSEQISGPQLEALKYWGAGSSAFTSEECDSGNRMQGYMQEDPYSGHHRFSPHHDSYYNDGGGGGGGDLGYNYDGDGSQYIQDDRPMKGYADIPNGGPYSSNSNLHPDDNMHHLQQLQQSGRSRTPSDYAVPGGGAGGRDLHDHGDDRGAGGPPGYRDDYLDQQDMGYPDQYPGDYYSDGHQGYPGDDNLGGYPPPNEDRAMYGNQGDYYDDRGPPFDPQGQGDYPPPSHSPHHQYRDGVLHDDGYGQRDSYAGSYQDQPSYPQGNNYNDDPYGEPERHSNHSGSYLDQPQQQPPSRYNGGVHYPEDNYMDQPSYSQEQPGYYQDPPGYQDQPSYHQDQPSYHQDQPSFHQDQPSYHQDQPSFHQDQPSFHQDQPSYHQDQPSYHQDQPSFHQDQPSYHQDQPSYHGSRQELPHDSYHPDQDPSFHDPRHDSYQGPYDPHQGQYSPAQRGQYDVDPYDPNQGSYPMDPNNQGPYDPSQDPNSLMPRDRHSLDQPASGSYHGDYRPSSRLQDSSFRNDPVEGGNYSPLQQHGLPQVRTDPFADDPFQERSTSRLQEDPYFQQSHGGRGSPSGGPDPVPYDERVPPYDDRDGLDPYVQSVPRYPDEYPPGHMGPGYRQHPNDPYTDQRDHDLSRRMDQQLNLGSSHHVPPHSPYSRGPQQGVPNPDLQEVIDFLMSHDDTVKASAAAHLQHVTYMDDAAKAKARSMGAVPPLIRLLSHELVEVHKNACGALQNLSYGKNNIDNKREIRNENGIPELIRLLRKTDQEDVKESVTGVLWNLSSAEDLKQAIIEDGLTVLINSVILRYSGWSALGNQSSQLPWTTVCRNTTGILRNVSSAGFDARKRMRECKGLVNALIYVLKLAAEDEESNAIDNKVVENTVCVLRNLSFRIQEVVDPDFYKKRSLPRQQSGGQGKGGKNDSNAGCFGNKSNKARAAQSNKTGSQTTGVPPQLPPTSVEYRSLWGSEIHSLYSTVLKRCTNPITMEAAAGAIQNLTACDWQPAVDSRSMVRKEKGLPLLVDLLSAESDRVVCATATALRNLAIDEKNKELVGKYAIRQLVSRLPRDLRSNMPDDTICAVVATLYEVIKDNQDFAHALVQEDGLPRLMHINTSEGRYLARTLKFTLSLLKTLWGFKSLHQDYTRLRYTQTDFTTQKAYARKDGSRPPDASATPTSSNHTTPYNTLSRPMSGQEGYDDNTLTPQRGGGMMRPGQLQGSQGLRYQASDHDGYRVMNRSNASLHDSRDRHNYSRDRIPPEEIALNDMASGYAPLDEPRPHRTKPPAGGVPLFPNLSPVEPSTPPSGSSSGRPDYHMTSQGPEPLYAQVNKGGRRRQDAYDSGPVGPPMSGSPHGSLHHSMDSGVGAGGADSWV